ncbi:hypothetical protein GCM10022295_90770 [Streptomyces osmaniensis]|uniref:Transposase n=1 Tax=Streptomyces osmaniensis TaxID=593134 RepID=A0ABP6Z2F7_9ACTN
MPVLCSTSALRNEKPTLISGEAFEALNLPAPMCPPRVAAVPIATVVWRVVVGEGAGPVGGWLHRVAAGTRWAADDFEDEPVACSQAHHPGRASRRSMKVASMEMEYGFDLIRGFALASG